LWAKTVASAFKASLEALLHLQYFLS